jgi:hypothetical protein
MQPFSANLPVAADALPTPKPYQSSKSMNQTKNQPKRRWNLTTLLGLFLRLCKRLRILRDALRALNIVLTCVLVVDREIALDALCEPLRHLREFFAEPADGLSVHIGVCD